MTSVYLAGPEVFLREGRDIIERKRAICRQFGLIPTELHAELTMSAELGHAGFGLAISGRNEFLMNQADVCIANLTPFRGPSADAGTVFELGYMIAQGKPAFGFTNDPQDYRERVAHLLNVDLSESDGGLFTPDGQMVENHGMADNLMIEGGIRSRGHTLLRAEARPEDVWGDLTTFRLLVSQIAESV